ncbi:hypothetical protein M1O29_00565 [Dehalococcoidia bacterium]|nr:hypothetical protein [Dehalococcoidia bacterium]
MSTLDDLAEKTKSAEKVWLTMSCTDGTTSSSSSWFIHDGDRLYILSPESSAEVSTIQVNSAVRVAIGSETSPDRLEMTGEIMSDPAWIPMMLEMLQHKYGDRFPKELSTVTSSAKEGHVIIKLKPVP